MASELVKWMFSVLRNVCNYVLTYWLINCKIGLLNYWPSSINVKKKSVSVLRNVLYILFDDVLTNWSINGLPGYENYWPMSNNVNRLQSNGLL